MKYTFELYITGDQLLPEHWAKLYKAIMSYAGSLTKFEVIFSSQDGVIRYLVRANQDLGALSNNLDGMVLRPVDPEDLQIPVTTKSESGVQFVTGGNLLDLKEKYSVKKGRDLQLAHLKIRTLSHNRSLVGIDLYFKNAGNEWSKAHKITTFFPTHLLATDFGSNARYVKKSSPQYVSIEKSAHLLLTENINALFEVETFPYFPKNQYLNLTSYDFDKHSLIVGASGSGKSKLISLIVDRLSKTALKSSYRFIIIDPHASLAADLSNIDSMRDITFGANDGADLFPNANTDLTSATELTATLFKSVLADQFNPRVDRLLRYSLFVLMTAQTMNLENLKRFITDVEYRSQLCTHVKGYVPENVLKYFGADYNEIRTQYYETAILPLVTMIDEMQLQPSLVGTSETSLMKTIQDNYVTVFSLNKVSMGEKVVKTVAGLLIQQIFLLAQARVFGQKIVLIIDEVSVVQNPAIAQILAEARKFNLSIILTQQYFGQVDKDLRDAIFANVYNYYAFKVSEEDATALEGNLNIELPTEVIANAKERGLDLKNLKVKLMTELSPRQCLIRIMANGQITPAIKARTMDAPVSTPKERTAAQLVPVPQNLPEKYVEPSDEPREIRFSQDFMEMLAAQAIQPTVATYQPPQRPVASIRDLLASHSSSRIKVNKD